MKHSSVVVLLCLFSYPLTHVLQELQSNMQCQYIRWEIKTHISLSLYILFSLCQDAFQLKLPKSLIRGGQNIFLWQQSCASYDWIFYIYFESYLNINFERSCLDWAKPPKIWYCIEMDFLSFFEQFTHLKSFPFKNVIVCPKSYKITNCSNSFLLLLQSLTRITI